MKNGFILNGEKYFELDNSDYSVKMNINESNDVITRSDVINCKKSSVFDYKELIIIEDFVGKINYYESGWCREFTAKTWNTRNKKTELFSYGRTTQTFYPYLQISNRKKFYALNLLPKGDWRIVMEMDRQNLYITIDRNNTRTGKGEVDVNLDLFIICADSINELYIKQQKYVKDNYYLKKDIPVSYNTWLDRFYNLDWNNMVNQADACAYLGVETFIVDAGWFGNLEAWKDKGNWNEKKNLFKNGKTLKDFADYVRYKGLNFGIWLEVMAMHKDAPVRVAHPELFVPFEDDLDYFLYDSKNPKAMDLMFEETCKVIRNYNVKWLKIDNNSPRNKEENNPHIEESLGYYNFLDRLAKEFPDLVIENCASGGLTGDMETMSHYHTNFASDIVYADELIRIQREACKVYPPCFINNWACAHPLNKNYHIYERAPFDTTGYALNPKDGTGTGMESFPISYIFGVNFLGNLSLTGNFADMNKKDLEIVKKHIDLYKEYRDFIFNSYYLECESDNYAYILGNEDFSECLFVVMNTNNIYYSVKDRVKAKMPINVKEYKITNLLRKKKDRVANNFSGHFGYKEVKMYKMEKIK